jgi:flagellin-specific chaperone FliS
MHNNSIRGLVIQKLVSLILWFIAKIFKANIFKTFQRIKNVPGILSGSTDVFSEILK